VKSVKEEERGSITNKNNGIKLKKALVLCCTGGEAILVAKVSLDTSSTPISAKM
jgi:hypothetical protein